MRLILVRHGETEWNEKSIFRGREDIPLNDTGIRQAYAAADRLSAYKIDSIYSSPLNRALETAQIIGTQFGIRAKAEDDLVDFDFGEWQGAAKENIEKLFPELYTKWMKEPQAVRIPGGETLDLVKIRVSRVLNRLPAAGGGDIIIVSHRVILKVLICAALSIGDSGFWRIRMDVGSISVLENEDGKFRLSLLNDTYHLGQLKSGPAAEDF